MTEQNIEQFNPTKAEMLELVNKSKELTIKDINDVEGYNAVHTARMALKKEKVRIKETGKQLREKALQEQRAIITLEKEILSIVEPAEKELEKKQRAIDELKKIESRKKLTPERLEKLTEVGVTDIKEETLLDLDEPRFNDFLVQCKEAFLEEKERKIKEDREAENAKIKEAQEVEAQKIKEAQDKIDAQRKELEDKERKLNEEKRIEEAKKQAREDERKQAEIDKQQAVADAEKKAEREKQAIIDAQKAKEKAAIKEREDARLENERLEKNKRFEDFLSVHNYNEDDFIIQTDMNKRTLYQKVGEIIL